MTLRGVPCTCRIPDPVVVNGTCLVCYGDRDSKPISDWTKEYAEYLRDLPDALDRELANRSQS